MRYTLYVGDDIYGQFESKDEAVLACMEQARITNEFCFIKDESTGDIVYCI